MHNVFTFALQNKNNMKAIANKIRKFLKENNFENAMVKVNGEILIIDNIGYETAQNIAQVVTGLDFEYMSESMTKLKA